jgi:hypothetical protein
LKRRLAYFDNWKNSFSLNRMNQRSQTESDVVTEAALRQNRRSKDRHFVRKCMRGIAMRYDVKTARPQRASAHISVFGCTWHLLNISHIDDERERSGVAGSELSGGR